MDLKPLIVIAAAALWAGIASSASATGGQRVLSQKQTCQMTVPPGWKLDQKLKGVAKAPDGSMSAVISNGADDTDLALAKQVMESSYPPTQVFQDTPQRLFYEYEQQGKFPFGVYAGVPGKHSDVCGTQIVFKRASQLDAAKQIALSVGSAP